MWIKQAAYRLPNLRFAGCRYTMGQFIALVAQVDAVVSCDTFGLHLAVALRKPVVALSGPQPHNEIDLYGLGTVLHAALECAPCFAFQEDQCTAQQPLMCMSSLNVDAVYAELKSVVS